MEDAPGTTQTLTREVPEHRDCTRCDGAQHLVGSDQGMGKYRCDTCGLIVGFDLASDTPEFVIDRGQASRYTKDVFGEVLTAAERRLHG